MFKRHRMFLFPDIELINDREESGVSVCTTLPFQLSSSDICCLGTVQTSEDNFSISLLCLKNLKYSWLNLPRTVWRKCSHAWQNNSRSFSWVVSNIHFWSAVICEHICLLSRLSVLLHKAGLGLVDFCTVSSEHLKHISVTEMNDQACAVQHELLACASEFQFLTTDFPTMI